VSEKKEKEWHNYFYIGSLNHKGTSNLPGQHEIDFHYIQKFYKSHTKITLLNKENTKILYSQKSRLQPCKNHTHKPGITPGTKQETHEIQNLMVALPSQPYTSYSSFYQAKMPPRSTNIFNLHLAVVQFRERERVFQ